jgi:hypothetical protein
LHVEVTVKGGRIEAVRVTKHEEKQFYSALTDTPGQIVRKQGVKGVDAVTGATMTSEAIIKATAKSLAGGMRRRRSSGSGVQGPTMRLNLFRKASNTSGRLGRILWTLGPTWAGSPIRRLAQVLCLLGFLILFFYVCWPYGSRAYAEAFRAKEIVEAELFLLLDPLVSISTALAGKMLIVSLTAAGIVIVVCLVFPRAFCGYICPLGTLLDGFDWLIGRRVTRRQLEREGWWANLRYFLLTAVLVAAVFGVLLSGFCAALAVLTRAMLFICWHRRDLKGWYLVPLMNFGHLRSCCVR